MESKELKNIIPIQSIWEDLDLLEDRLIEISSSDDPYLTDITILNISWWKKIQTIDCSAGRKIR